MKTIILFLLISCNASAQFLSKSKKYIDALLKEQKIDFTYEENKYILVKNISNCIFLFEFNKEGICVKETITALTNPAIASIIMDLNDKNYVVLNNIYFHEESYGLVKVVTKKNTFIYSYE